MKFVTTISVLLLLLFSASPGMAKEEMSEFEKEKQTADAYYDSGDYKKASRAYTKLAKRGDKYSQFRLSLIYLDGLAGKQSVAEAYGWASLAAQVRHPGLLAYRDQVFDSIPEKEHRKAIAKADKYMLRYSDFVLAQKTLDSTKRDLRNCTGSRLGRSCEQVKFASSIAGAGSAPGVGVFNPGGGGGDPVDPGAGFSNIAGISSQGGGGASRQKYYTDLRNTIQSLEDYIAAYKSGNVQIGDFEVIEEEPKPDEIADDS